MHFWGKNICFMHLHKMSTPTHEESVACPPVGQRGSGNNDVSAVPCAVAVPW